MTFDCLLQEQSVCYWPSDKVHQHGDMFIEQQNMSSVPQGALPISCKVREFSVTNTKVNDSRLIKQYQYTDWLDGQAPPTAAHIIDLIGAVQKTQHTCGGGPIVIHDR